MSSHCHHHNCIEELKTDHQIILAHLDDLEAAINQPTISHAKIEGFLRFTETFAEPHHQKEEQVLFPALEKKGMPNEGGPIGMMLTEHAVKRDYLAKMKKSLKENNNEKLKENALAMISLLREHINKEDSVLYPCAQDMLTKEELIKLGSRCKNL